MVWLIDYFKTGMTLSNCLILLYPFAFPVFLKLSFSKESKTNLKRSNLMKLNLSKQIFKTLKIILLVIIKYQDVCMCTVWW